MEQFSWFGLEAGVFGFNGARLPDFGIPGQEIISRSPKKNRKPLSHRPQLQQKFRQTWIFFLETGPPFEKAMSNLHKIRTGRRAMAGPFFYKR
jgi:hypothetical protein